MWEIIPENTEFVGLKSDRTGELTFTLAGRLKENPFLGEDAEGYMSREIFRCRANSWAEARQKWNDFNGWGIYIPPVNGD